MTISTGDILKIVATAVWLDGNLNQNVFNAVVTGAGGPWDNDDIVADAVSWMGTVYGNLTAAMSDELDGSQVQVYEYDDGDDDWDEVGSSAWVWNPSNVDEQLPRGVAALINAKTTNADVSGKKYLGGNVEGNVDDGLWAGAYITDIEAWADDWITGFVGGTSGADWLPGVWSPTKTNFFYFVGSTIVPTIPAYQRRRKQGVGV
jgi:hypothetical protein